MPQFEAPGKTPFARVDVFGFPQRHYGLVDSDMGLINDSAARGLYPARVPFGHLVDSRNIFSVDRYSVASRPGFRHVANVDENLFAQYRWMGYVTDGAEYFLIGEATSTDNQDGVFEVDLSSPAIVSLLAPTVNTGGQGTVVAHESSLYGQGIVFMASQSTVGTPQFCYVDTGVPTVVNLPVHPVLTSLSLTYDATTVVGSAGGRLWYNVGNLILFSDQDVPLDNVADYSSENWFYLGGSRDSSERIVTAMVTVGDYIFFFTRNQVWRSYAPDPLASPPEKVMQNFGVEAQAHVTVARGLIYFHNRQGVWVWDGSSPQPQSLAYTEDGVNAVGRQFSFYMDPGQSGSREAVLFDPEYAHLYFSTFRNLVTGLLEIPEEQTFVYDLNNASWTKYGMVETLAINTFTTGVFIESRNEFYVTCGLGIFLRQRYEDAPNYWWREGDQEGTETAGVPWEMSLAPLAFAPPAWIELENLYLELGTPARRLPDTGDPPALPDPTGKTFLLEVQNEAGTVLFSKALNFTADAPVGSVSLDFSDPKWYVAKSQPVVNQLFPNSPGPPRGRFLVVTLRGDADYPFSIEGLWARIKPVTLDHKTPY